MLHPLQAVWRASIRDDVQAIVTGVTRASARSSTGRSLVLIAVLLCALIALILIVLLALAILRRLEHEDD